ncbi:MAG TPA: hypothetical protein VFB24_16055 [Candidatus Binatia bacterium]|jgi:hypothetical protein|nr:hypothetical protein [Candidatus Binatia bacterium]
MKRAVRNLLAVGVSFIALSALSLAQDSTYQVKVNIPFGFYAADQQLPAGNYVFSVNYETHAVTLRNRESGRSFALIALPDDADSFGQAYVDFESSGGSYHLAELKTANAGISFSQPNSAVTTSHMRRVPAVVAALR